MAPSEPLTWIVDPALVVNAIKLLAGAVALLGSALIGTLLYIWHGTKKEITGLSLKVDSIATSLNTLASTTTTEIAVIKAKCEDRHK